MIRLTRFLRLSNYAFKDKPSKKVYNKKMIEKDLLKYEYIWELYYDNFQLFKLLRSKHKDLLIKQFPEYSRREWTEDAVIEHSSHYKRVLDFYRCEEYAYEYADFNDLFDTKITHFDNHMRPDGYWNDERVIMYQTKVTSRKELYIRFHGIGSYISNHHKQYLITIEKDDRKKHYTEQECYEIAKSCRYVSYMKLHFGSAYRQAKENGWFEQYTWFNESVIINEPIYCVYVNKSDEYNFAYIGLTTMERFMPRWKEHKNNLDSLSRYCRDIKISVPKPEMLEKDLYPEQAQDLEDKWKKFYTEAGYKILSTGATGIGTGSLGNHGNKPYKWTEEKCYEEALKYEFINDFNKNSHNAFVAAKSNGWFKTYTWLKYKVKKDYSLEELIAEVKKYDTFTDFHKYSRNYYIYAWTNGLLDEVKKILPSVENHKPYTYDEIIIEAKQYEYIEDFYEYSHNFYRSAERQNILHEIKSLLKSRKEENRKINYSFERLLLESLKYKTSGEFHKNDRTNYNRAYRKDYLKHFYWNSNMKDYWTFDICKEEFLKYQDIEEFEKNCYGGYHMSLLNGWLEEFLTDKNK